MSLRSSLGLTQEATASQKKMKSWTGKQEGACWLIWFIKTTFRTHSNQMWRCSISSFPFSEATAFFGMTNWNENKSCSQFFFFLLLTVSHLTFFLFVWNPWQVPLMITNSHATHPTRKLFFWCSTRSPQAPTVASMCKLTCTTPAGFTPIITQIPRKAESFSSLSLMFLSDVHLTGGTVKTGSGHVKPTETFLKLSWIKGQARLNMAKKHGKMFGRCYKMAAALQ